MYQQGIIYRADYVAPEIDESAIDTIGVGLYRVKGKDRRGDLYNPSIDDLDRDVDQVLMVRVDDGPTDLPMGVERAEIRADGKRLIVGWMKKG